MGREDKPLRTGEAPRPRGTAATYIRATHPDTGQPVAYVPGEALPAWVADALNAGKATYDGDTGAWVLDPPTRRGKP